MLEQAVDPCPVRLAAAARWITDLLDRRAAFLYGAMLAGLLLLVVAAARLLTIDVDEAWILLSEARAFGLRVPDTAASGTPAITTGGVHLLAHGLLAFGTSDILAHRVVSILTTLALLALVHVTLTRLGQTRQHAMLGTVLFAAVPGFLMSSALAMGEIMATLLLIAAALCWVWRGQDTLRGAVGCGLLLGAACATRVNCLAAIPGLIAYAAVVSGVRAPLGRAVVAGAVGAMVAGIAISLYHHVGLTTAGAGTAGYLGQSTGLDLAKPLGRAVLAMRIANEHLPFLLLVAISGGWLHTRTPDAWGRAGQADVAGVLLFLGLPMLAAWLLLAPIAHLRYLWPALACIWLAGVVVILQLTSGRRSLSVRLTLHGIALTAAAYTFAAAVPTIAAGDSLVVQYQSMGLSPRLGLRPEQRFRAAADQRRLAAFLASRPREATFFEPMLEAGYPLTYLSGRTIMPLVAMPPTGERYIVISPADYAIWHPEPRFGAWLHAFTSPALTSGGHAAMRVHDDAPPPPLGRVSVGQNDLF